MILQMQCIGQIMLSFVRTYGRDSLSSSSHLFFTNKAFEGCTQMLYQHKRAVLTYKHCRGEKKNNKVLFAWRHKDEFIL